MNLYPNSGLYRRTGYRSLLHAAKIIVHTEGLVGLFRGLSLSLLGVIPLEGGRFGIFWILRSILDPYASTWGIGENWISFGSGYIAGVGSLLLAYPVDCVRRRTQAMQLTTEAVRANVDRTSYTHLHRSANKYQ